MVGSVAASDAGKDGAAQAGADEAPRLLAIESSTSRLALALVQGTRELLFEAAGGAEASRAVLPAALQLCTSAGIPLSALQAVAFGRGPGAFTGLRTACAVAQGLAFGLDRPVLPLDTLACVAEDARARIGVDTLWVAMDARMDEVYAAEYRFDGAGWQARVAPGLYTLDALRECWRNHPPAAVAGSAIGAFGARLPLPPGLPQDPEATPGAAALARLARAAWRQGGLLPAAQALPLYLRDKVALTTAERLALRAEKAVVS